MDGASLVSELKNASQDILATGENFILDETQGVFQLCFVLEKILNHGLKDLAFIGKTSFWEFLEHIDKCLPGTGDVLTNVRECSKTPLGRGRVFIRVSLNEGAATDYLKALVWNRDLSRKYYKDSSLLRHDQLFSLVLNHLDSLSAVKFSLVVKDPGFDDPAYYDKMALELVMSGQRSQSSLTNIIAKANQAAASQPNYVSAVTTPVKSQNQQSQPQTPQPSQSSTPVQPSPAVASPAPTPIADTTPTPDPTPVPQTPNLSTPTTTTTQPSEIKTHSTKRKTKTRAPTKIDGPSTPIEAPKNEPLVEAKVEPTVEPPIESKVEPEAESKVEPKIEPKDEPTLVVEPEIVANVEQTNESKEEKEDEPKAELTVSPVVEPEVVPKDVPTPESDISLTVTVPLELSQAPIRSPASTISDSDMVPVKMHYHKSPASSNTESDSSLFSSAEIMSSQTSTPSFTNITDDTDLSPLTTPNMHMVSAGASPILTIDNSQKPTPFGSDTDNKIPSLSIYIKESNQEPNTPIVNTTNSPPEMPFAQASPPTERVPEIDETIDNKAEPDTPNTNIENGSNGTESVSAAEPEDKEISSGEVEQSGLVESSLGLQIDVPTERKVPENVYTPTVLPPLVQDLKRDVYAVLEGDVLIQQADSLLSTIEKILCNKIRSGAAFSHAPLPMDQVWAFVRFIPSYLSGTEALFEEIRANREVETDMGRARSWMRVALNHAALANHLKVLLSDHKRVIEYYEETALLRSYEHQAMILVLIDSLSSGRFCLQTHDEYIDIQDKKYMERKALTTSMEKSKKRLTVQRRKKASIETVAEGSDSSNTTPTESPELEVNVVTTTRTRRSSSASRTKRPVISELNQNSDAPPPLVLSATPPSLVTTPPTLHARPSSPRSLASSTSSEEPAPSTNIAKSGEIVAPAKVESSTDFELPPMPQISTGGFISLSTDVMQQIQQMQIADSEPPSSSQSPSSSQPTPTPQPPSTTSSSSSLQPPSTSPTSRSLLTTSSPFISSSPPAASNEPSSTNSSPSYPSYFELPRTIPFGVPHTAYEFNDSNKDTTTNNYSFNNTSYASIYRDPTIYNSEAIASPGQNSPPAQPFFHRPLNASISFSASPNPDSLGNTPTTNTYSYSTSADDDSRVTVTDDFLRARLSDDYEPAAKTKAVDVVGRRKPSSNGIRTSASADNDASSDEGGSSYGSMKYGSTPGEDMNPATNPLVKESHYILDNNKKVLRNTSCPGCNANISHGIFSGSKLCSYYNAYYCNKCHVGDEAIIPARLVHQLDPKAYPVCSEARGHIHQYYRHPQLNMKALNPAAYKYSATLEKGAKLRRQLKFLGDYVKTCRNKESLLNLMDGRQYMLDSLDVYSLRDLIDAISGSLLPFLYAILEKFISHVTKSCVTCKGKGFYCEFCNSGDLLFSWMVLKASECMQCPGCRTLVHTKCYKKGNGDCPKCKRIAALKAKHSSSTPH